MTLQPEKDGHTPAQTTDRHRHDISQGLTGEKAPYSDPAAAPLGTDDEAGGHTTPAHVVAQASRAEYNPGKATPGLTDERGRAVSGELHPHKQRLTFVLVAVIVVVAALAVTAILLSS